MTQFLHSDIVFRSRGDVLEVTLTNGANVRLLDSLNLAKYKRGQAHRYTGGLATKSPVRIPIPSAGHWHAVVDMQGLRGSTRASFRVITGAGMKPLPPIRDHRQELFQIADNASAVFGVAENREFDVFVSHATEAKRRSCAHSRSPCRIGDSRCGSMSSNFELATASVGRSTQVSLA